MNGKFKKQHLFEIEIVCDMSLLSVLIIEYVCLIFCYVTQWHSYIFPMWLVGATLQYQS